VTREISLNHHFFSFEIFERRVMAFAGDGSRRSLSRYSTLAKFIWQTTSFET
jgi:hypothetical protein